VNRKGNNLPDCSKASRALVDAEEWWCGEIKAGLAELDAGKTVSHARVVRWLKSWGQHTEERAPTEE
jgi:predicted transcriptional regulator